MFCYPLPVAEPEASDSLEQQELPATNQIMILVFQAGRHALIRAPVFCEDRVRAKFLRTVSELLYAEMSRTHYNPVWMCTLMTCEFLPCAEAGGTYIYTLFCLTFGCSAFEAYGMGKIAATRVAVDLIAWFVHG